MIRIFSDLHYGDRASRVHSLAQLAPLLDGPSQVIVNGDSLDTRQGPDPQRTAELREEILNFFGRSHPQTRLMTGNHDPDISALHALDFTSHRVFVTHGDVLFEDIVPWGRDVPSIRASLAAARAALTAAEYRVLETRLILFRRICAALPQRHQVERNRWKYLRSFAADTFWPPLRLVHILRAWREAPRRATALIGVHRPDARFAIVGHVHRPGVWHSPQGRIAINTGSFCPPLGACLVDLAPDRLIVRRIKLRRGSFHPGTVQAEFALAEQ